MRFIDYIYKKNGRIKTRRNLVILFFAPWVIFVWAVLANFMSGIAQGQGIHALKTSIFVVAIGCLFFSFYNVGIYFWRWWKPYKKYSAQERG